MKNSTKQNNTDVKLKAGNKFSNNLYITLLTCFIAGIVFLLISCSDQDPAGKLKLKTVNHKYTVVNAAAGELFVITGQLENGYGHPRSHLSVMGKILSKGNVVVSSPAFYAGNILSNKELETLAIGTIMERLSNKAGGNSQNVNVQPGHQVPYMIVIPDFPETLDEYYPEPVGSEKGK